MLSHAYETRNFSLNADDLIIRVKHRCFILLEFSCSAPCKIEFCCE